MINPAELAGVLAQLGIEGIDPTKLAALIPVLQQLGMSTPIDHEKVKEYFAQVGSDDWYVPKAPKNFYGDWAGLRKLTTPRFPKMY